MVARFWHARSRKTRCGSSRLLCAEPLESRTVLAPLSMLGNLHALTSFDAAPTVTKAASANVNSSGYVSGRTALLSVRGGDAQAASTLVYDWAITSTPGAARPNSASTTATRRKTTL